MIQQYNHSAACACIHAPGLHLLHLPSSFTHWAKPTPWLNWTPSAYPHISPRSLSWLRKDPMCTDWSHFKVRTHVSSGHMLRSSDVNTQLQPIENNSVSSAFSSFLPLLPIKWENMYTEMSRGFPQAPATIWTPHTLPSPPHYSTCGDGWPSCRQAFQLGAALSLLAYSYQLPPLSPVSSCLSSVFPLSQNHRKTCHTILWSVLNVSILPLPFSSIHSNLHPLTKTAFIKLANDP